jgi:hypothetical protein
MCINRDKSEGFEIVQNEVVHVVHDVWRNTSHNKLDQIYTHLGRLYDHYGFTQSPESIQKFYTVQDLISMYIIRLQNRKDPSEGYDLIDLSNKGEETRKTLNDMRLRIQEALDGTANRAQLADDLRNLMRQMFNAQFQRDKFRNEPKIPGIEKLQKENCNLNMKIPVCPVKDQTAFCTSTGWMCPIMWTSTNQLPPVNDRSSGL